jgi:putative ABC transport system permease protein
MFELLRTFSWQELRHHPWRNAAAVLAVMLGVALAFSVHLINASALDEFAQATRSVSGQPDLSLTSAQGNFDEAVYALVARHPLVASASPVLEVNTQATDGAGARLPLRVVGVDAIVVATVSPDLLPRPDADADRLALFAPATVFLNASARQRLGRTGVQLQTGLRLQPVLVAGSLASGGAPLAVMDLGAAQDLFDRQGQLSRIDLRLQAGADRAALVRELQTSPGWPAGLGLSEPGDAAERLGNLSRAYRVNLTVLALIALFTGAFLVFSVLALSVAKRAQQFALLGVLGLSARARLALVLWEALALGVVGSAAGVALGTALAALALKLLGGDLGGGYFTGVAPQLQWQGSAALLYGLLGVAAALVGGWWPARQAQALPPAQTLKGLGSAASRPHQRWLSMVLIAAGLALTRAPAIFDLPVAAYLSVALLLVGGIGALPWLIALLLDRLSPWVQRWLLPLLAVERARRQRDSAAVALSGVVASLALAVALTVMVASFRASVTDWLDRLLPADLYVRSATTLRESDTLFFSPALVQAAAALPGVQSLRAQRQLPLLLDPARPPVALLVSQIDDPARSLPLVGTALPVPPGQIGIYVSEAMVDLYGAQPGAEFAPLYKHFWPPGHVNTGGIAPFFVAGVWRDYARQSGSIALDRRAYERISPDRRVNDLAVWLQDGASPATVQQGIRALAEQEAPGAGALLEFGTASQIRATSLKIFDRSFAVTYWLQAVAIGIGLFGVAASFSAQVLARRKEFGLLAHLGLTRRQILTVVTAEGAVWTSVGAIAGLGLGLAVAVVLVKVVNPQSFHWTMDLMLPWPRLLLLCLAVVLAGTLTAWLSARPAAGRDAVLAVKEDW